MNYHRRIPQSCFLLIAHFHKLLFSHKVFAPRSGLSKNTLLIYCKFCTHLNLHYRILPQAIEFGFHSGHLWLFGNWRVQFVDFKNKYSRVIWDRESILLHYNYHIAILLLAHHFHISKFSSKLTAYFDLIGINKTFIVCMPCIQAY